MLGRSGPTGKRPLRATTDTLGTPAASGACKRHKGGKTPARGSGGKTGDMRENGASGPGRTAGRPRKMAAPPEKPAKPPPAAGAGERACNRRAGGPEGPLGFPPAAPAPCSKRIIFQHTFPLPRTGRPRTNPRVPAKKPRSVAKKAKANDAKQQRPKRVIVPKNPKKKRIPLTPEARREIQRTNHKEKLANAKASGLCRDCGEPAIEGQTRCEKCAEKHRVSRRKNDAERRAKANEANQLKRAMALAEKIEAGGPTKCRHCQDPPRYGQTRCERCADRHNEYRRRGEAKKRAQAQNKDTTEERPR